MKSIQLVIDIGSKFTTIAQEQKGFVLKDASLVYVASKGNKIELIDCGRNVANYVGRTSQNEQIIAPIKEGAIFHERAAVLMYRYYLNKVVSSKSLIKPRIKAIACVSCGLTNAQKHDIEVVLTRAGVSEVVVLESPLAVYASSNDGTAQCVVDIGDTKTEIAVVKKDGIVSGCTINIGGKTFNQAIADQLLDNQRCKLAPANIEKIKKEMASLSDNVRLVVNENVTILGSSEMKQIQIHSSDVKIAIEPLVKNICTVILSILTQTPENIANEVALNGILLCGGSSRMDGICEYIANEVGLPVRKLENPENAIILGGMYYIMHKNQLASLLNIVNLK